MKRLLTIVLFLFIIFPLFSASFNIGLVKEGNSAYFDEIKDVSEFIINNTVLNDEALIEKAYVRDLNYKTIQNEINNHKNGKSDELKVEEKTEEIELTIKEITSNEFLSSFNTDALNHALIINNLDALILPKISTYNSLTEIEVYYYDGELNLLIHTMLMHGDTLFEEYSKALLSKLNLNYGIIKIEDSVSGLNILNKKEDVSLYGSYILEKEGEVIYSLTAPYYSDKTIVINTEKANIKNVSFNMDKKTYDNLLLSSVPTNAIVTDGKDEYTLPHLFTSLSRPTVLTIQSVGYEDKILHITDEENNLTINLTPLSVVDNNRVELSKKRMYSSMRNTLFSFGFTVASMSINNIYKDDLGNTLLPLTIGLSGTTIISLLDFIDSVVDYYNNAKERL